MKSYEINGVAISDADIINGDLYGSPGYKNLYAFIDHGTLLAGVLADGKDEALDYLADSGKIAHLEISPETYDDYGGENAAWDNNACLGNESRLYDIVSVETAIAVLPDPSVCGSLFNSGKITLS